MEEITGNKYMEETSGGQRGKCSCRMIFVLRVLPLGYTILLHRFSRVPAIKTEGLFSESCSKGGKQERERKRGREEKRKIFPETENGRART